MMFSWLNVSFYLPFGRWVMCSFMPTSARKCTKIDAEEIEHSMWYTFYTGSNFQSTCWVSCTNTCPVIQVFFHFKHLVTTIVFLLRDNDATLIYILICSIYRRRCYHRYQGRWQLQRRHGRESRGYFKLSEWESLFTVQQEVSWWQKEQYLPLEQTTSSGSRTSFAASLWPKQERRKLWISVTYSKPTMKLRTSIARNIYRIRKSIHIRELLTQR